MSVLACERVPQNSAAEKAGVLHELSRRSGLPGAELGSLLEDCNKNQQSLFFCAWRDQIAAEQALNSMLNDKQHNFPQCAAYFQSSVTSWKKAGDLACEKSARKEWGEGSMGPTAQAVCLTQEIMKMGKRLQVMKGCNSLPK